ncbi:MAG: tetratricopeptide repeat protein [Microcoleaceae cyanobacterium]
MGNSITVNQAEFDADVIQRSYETVVLIDFFATWCGPCQILKPMLEKLAQEYDFLLAKVDIDQNSALANAYHVEGVPDVRVVVRGEVLPGFVGVLPEADLRQLLHQLGLSSDYDVRLAAIEAAMAAQEIDPVKTLSNQLTTQYPDRFEVRLKVAQFFLNQAQVELAQQFLEPIQADQPEFYAQAQALRQLIHFRGEMQQSGESELDQLYADACRLAVAGNYADALASFLNIVGQDRKYRNDGARKAMLTLFELLGNEDPITKKYRQQLMLQLY